MRHSFPTVRRLRMIFYVSSLRLNSVLATLVLTCTISVAAAQSDVRVDGVRLNKMLEDLKQFGVNADGGSDRIAYSQHNRDALVFLMAAMEEAGLTAAIDVAGNLVGKRGGTGNNLAPIITGSHIDTVPNGGHYDGIVGSLGAIEVARTLHNADISTRHPLEFIIWSNEEAGKVGSRSINGSVTADEMSLTALGEKTLGEGIAFLGGDPARLADNIREPGEVAALIELHVEQGAILDREGISIGVVEGIVGIRRWNITIDGFANHAGTTPMDQRQDALLVAAKLTTAINAVITSEPGAQVGTVGRIQAFPGAPNVIPGKVVMSLEIRDLQMAKVGHLFERIEAAASKLASDTNTEISFAQYYESPAALTDARIKDVVHNAATGLGLSLKHMPSGAGHDAQSFNDVSPLGMIFVPSVKGISHAPTEFTDPDDVTNGANVLLHSILELDRRLD